MLPDRRNHERLIEVVQIRPVAEVTLLNQLLWDIRLAHVGRIAERIVLRGGRVAAFPAPIVDVSPEELDDEATGSESQG